MKSERYLKITIRTSVGVYLPRGRVADRSSSEEALETRLKAASDFWDDGRRNFSVEQLQAAAETIVRNAIERLVDEHLRENDFKVPLQMNDPRVQEKFEDHVALAMARVSVRHTCVSDDHELEFEIEEEGEIQ